ncbi:hypothetical protein [Polaribacter sp. Asnod6-C07]|uniref:hypothetical protein n=1 Tax=Polaribacter sp. Asnod6-C07 TaxID=3160582 RepID=UPI0038686F48
MKIKFSILFFSLVIQSVFSQKDSIVSYLNRKFEINNNSNNKNDVAYLKTQVKKDALWENIIYYRKGNIFRKYYSKNLNEDIYVGKFLEYHRNGKLKKRVFYDNSGYENESIIILFDNGKRNYTGQFLKGIDINLWKYYHYNGQVAAKFYKDKKGNITKSVFFDEKGQDVPEDEYIKFKKATFKGGIEKFNEKVKVLPYRIRYYVNTTIYVNYTINVDGDITDVYVINNVPKDLEEQIKLYLESIKGWSPEIDFNRKIPTNYTVKLNFSVIDE